MSGEQLERSILERKEREELKAIATAMSLEPVARTKKADLVDQILKAAGVEVGATTIPGPSAPSDGPSASSDGPSSNGRAQKPRASARPRSAKARGGHVSDEASDGTSQEAPSKRPAPSAEADAHGAEVDAHRPSALVDVASNGYRSSLSEASDKISEAPSPAPSDAPSPAPSESVGIPGEPTSEARPSSSSTTQYNHQRRQQGPGQGA
ncbi:MAG: hypothetical protein ACRDZ5_11130, partial [Acidimicrobiales bacterium]